jgi:HAD superfamily hydrolase (TIGR01549 family)
VTFGCLGTLVERQAGSDVVRPMADVEAMLAELRARHYRLGVLTNCNERQFDALHRTFSRPFDLFVTADRIRGRKPAPWHFRAFEQMAKVCRTRWVHVACSRQYDIVPAAALGVSAVWLDRARSVAEPRPAGVHVYSAAEAVDVITAQLERSRAVMAV